MKKNIVCMLFLTAIVIGPEISCSKKILDQTPVSAVSDDAVFNSTDPGLLTAFVNNIYQGLPHGMDWSMLASVTDEALTQACTWAGQQMAMLSQITSSNLGPFASGSSCPELQHFSWANEYSFIRATNLFFSRINSSPIDTATRHELMGEVFFLRAYLYHNLVSFYGGVPLITKAYALTDSFSVPRNTYAECIQFISDQCDSAAQYLPLQQAQVGRATQGAALALKSRVLLYAASDLYNGGNGSVPDPFASYSNPELVRYATFSGSDRQTRWQKAKAAALAVINSGQYSLYMPNPASQSEAATNYGNLFIQMSTSEDILVKYFSTNTVANWNDYGKTYGPGLYHNPNGFWGWGVDAPTQQFVDEYEMNDGTAFSWSNPTQAAAPYQNRDPRFYGTVLYDGAPWRQRTSDILPYEPTGKVQTGYQNTSSTNPTTDDIQYEVGGFDTHNPPTGANIWNWSPTGYYLRKWSDPTIDPLKVLQSTPWRFMRYTEVLLNYAEACLGLGDAATATTYINMIRTRAGMPGITSATMANLQHERKVELAFEELRYFDIRRWMICDPAVYGQKAGFSNVWSIHIFYPYNGSATYGSGTPVYTPVADVSGAGNYANLDYSGGRAWSPKFYFLPIAYDEMNKNLKLIQNPLY
jgi:starch-binding outer membrane protein, SusD/RagB family